MNHQSLLDPTIGVLTQTYFRISTSIAKDDALSWLPILYLYQPSTFIFISRPKKNPNGEVDNKSARETIKKFSQYVNRKMIGWICPEGTRNKNYLTTTPILPLKKGFIYALEDVKCDLVVMIYRDTGELMHSNGDL